MSGNPDPQKTAEQTFAQPANISQRSFSSRLAFLRAGLSSVLRGDIDPRQATLEAFRRGRAALSRRRERALLDERARQPAQLRPEFQKLTPAELLNHFQRRDRPSFFAGVEGSNSILILQQNLFPRATEGLMESARLIANEHRWPLLGFGELSFGEQVNWRRDPRSGRIWPLEFHADVALWHNDGSDIRVLWELNRLGHLLVLGRAYALTSDEQFAEEYFSQLESWQQQNPIGRGANWCCAMEVALRVMNLLASFCFFRRSQKLTAERLLRLLAMLDQHGAHIQRNLEFSYVATSNHYLSDIAGLLWLGIMLPELSLAADRRDWALNEVLRETDKQILADGADYEASTGYHRFVLELLLYSFTLCKTNYIQIKEKYSSTLHSMLCYLRTYLRPDGRAPLIGDTDGGQVLPLVQRNADDHAYLLALGAVIFRDSRFKLPDLEVCEELLWIFGEEGVLEYERLKLTKEKPRPPIADRDHPGHDATLLSKISSQGFADAGTYVLRNDDLYLLFNAGGAGGNGRASHGHNDALSIEVSACGRAFIVDPGTYVYTADLDERHLFRSTAYHSTIMVDCVEQNTTDRQVPFIIGDEAHPRVLSWDTGSLVDRVVAEHRGYERLPSPVRHRRTVTFEKAQRYWLIEDELIGTGLHAIAARFHFDAELGINADRDEVTACDLMTGARLFVCALDTAMKLELESAFVSRHYGERRPSLSACWSITTRLPYRIRWAIVPLGLGENAEERVRGIHTMSAGGAKPE